MDYFVLDIETCPIDLKGYEEIPEEEQFKKINPIDSKIVAIGLRYEDENLIFQSDNEVEILTKFWMKWKEIKLEHPTLKIVGFNVANFDISFLTTRSFINDVSIVPFVLKDVIDIKDKISAYRYGRTRGRLKEFGKLIGMEVQEHDGSAIADLCKNNEFEKIRKYLIKDLEITDALYKRLVKTKIIDIAKW